MAMSTLTMFVSLPCNDNIDLTNFHEAKIFHISYILNEARSDTKIRMKQDQINTNLQLSMTVAVLQPGQKKLHQIFSVACRNMADLCKYFTKESPTIK